MMDFGQKLNIAGLAGKRIGSGDLNGRWIFDRNGVLVEGCTVEFITDNVPYNVFSSAIKFESIYLSSTLKQVDFSCAIGNAPFKTRGALEFFVQN